MKMTSPLFWTLVLIASIPSTWAETLYEVDLAIDDGTVSGFIATDGVMGGLSADSILDWNLVLFNGTEGFVVSPVNSFVAFTGPVDATATADGLYFNFLSDPANIAFQQSGIPGWHFGIHASNVHPATFAVGPPTDFAQSFETGIVKFGNAIIVEDDGDGVPADVDNCSIVSNPDQRDTNGDGFGNACDPDINNDGVVNFADIALWASVFNTANNSDEDFNGDGSVNFLDYALFQLFFLQPPGPSGLVP